MSLSGFVKEMNNVLGVLWMRELMRAKVYYNVLRSKDPIILYHMQLEKVINC